MLQKLLLFPIDSNQIFVMDKGEIVEQGSMEEVLAQKGLFYEMWHA